jgi:glucans biosynthesis protein
VIDCPAPEQGSEEFPLFRSFWLEPLTEGWGIVVNALLDSPSITGAYRMAAIRGNGVFMSVQARLFPRRKIERLGIAPLTSMFWYAKHNRKRGVDWRPEIHDSDGLAIWAGTGERIWRPLNNPACKPQSDIADVKPSAFSGEKLKGFGLLQRERRFSCYEYSGARYDLRPCAWIEPIGDWPKGNVKLVEISTEIETADNIVAYWAPEELLEVGKRHEFSYKLHWQLDQPHAPRCATVIATRLGAGGNPGAAPLKDTVKYVVDFKGGKLPQLSKPGDIQAVVSAKPSDLGTIVDVLCYPVLDG